jgi:hypothetical protein
MFSDWMAYFWPQLTHPWTLQKGVYNLPWLFVALQPVRIFGPLGALLVVQLLSILVVVRLGHFLRLSKFRMMLVLLSPPVLWNIFMGQIDGLVMAAYLVPPVWSVSLALVKPQASLGAGWRAIRHHPWLLALALVLIVTAWRIWGWPFSVEEPDVGGPFANTLWNWSGWPFGLLFAPLLFSRDWRGAMFASPFLLPYSGVQSLIGPMLVVATLPLWAFLSLWVAAWVRWAYMLQLIH